MLYIQIHSTLKIKISTKFQPMLAYIRCDFCVLVNVLWKLIT